MSDSIKCPRLMTNPSRGDDSPTIKHAYMTVTKHRNYSNRCFKTYFKIHEVDPFYLKRHARATEQLREDDRYRSHLGMKASPAHLYIALP